MGVDVATSRDRSGAAGNYIATGGSWKEGESAGSYRLILTGGEAPGGASRAFLQWLEPSARGAPFAVVATRELPVTDGLINLRDGHVSTASSGQACAEVRGRWNGRRSLDRRPRVFALGGPREEIHRVRACGAGVSVE